MTLELQDICKVDGCNNTKEIKEFCKFHYWANLKRNQKRKTKKVNKELGIQEKTPLKIPKISKKWHKRNLQYQKARKEYLKDHCCCEAKLTGCTIPNQNYDNIGIQIHHRAGRIGDNLFDKKNFLAVCFNCHNYIELNVEWAILNGFSVSRLQKESPE